jgi:DNA end-binding protein Ku
MRSIWTGAISFGLVVIPVKLYAATEQRDITFRQVHREDGARIQFRRVCTLDGAEVPYADIAKGYELPTGDMVVLTDEDLADLPLVTAHRIEVLHFAPAVQVEPIYANKSYYTEPEQAGARAYVLFRDALEASGKVAVAKVALRQREALAALRVREGVITLETLLWPDEVRKPDFAFLDEDIDVRSQELKMAASLIDTMTEDFEPDQYHDTYREALEAVVQAKVEGNDVVRPAGIDEPEPKTQAADLTEILRASVAALKGGRAQSGDGEGDGAKAAGSSRSRTRGTSKASTRKTAGTSKSNSTSTSKSSGTSRSSSASKTSSSKSASASKSSGTSTRRRSAKADDADQAAKETKTATRRKASA